MIQLNKMTIFFPKIYIKLMDSSQLAHPIKFFHRKDLRIELLIPKIN